jgi:hypothetical protein
MKLNNIVDDGKERRRGKMGTKFIMLCREKMKWGKKRLTMVMIREDEMQQSS